MILSSIAKTLCGSFVKSTSLYIMMASEYGFCIVCLVLVI